jgi:Zn-dependent protease with chaperone function
MSAVSQAPAPQSGVRVYGNEGTLFALHVLISLVFWVALIVGTLGIALLYILFFFVAYLFAQSAVISWLRGNGVRITAQQFPDLHRRYLHCCQAVGLDKIPEAYVVNGSGVLNAFATRFLGRYFVVLYSNVVDAMMEKPEAINFYIGHELGHIRRKHLAWGPLIWPASILPIIGAAYSRAREYTCDQFGRACCADAQAAVHGLTALAAGEKRWAVMNVPAYLEQVKDTRGFWMSFHELVADYPWLVKRVGRIADGNYKAPSRNPLAWIPALFVPRLGIGGGGAASMLIVVAIIGILAAIAIPAYQDYIVRTQTAQAMGFGQVAAQQVASFYASNERLPRTLEEAGLEGALPPGVRQVAIDPGSGVVTLTMEKGPVAGKSLMMIPSVGADKRVQWRCASDDIPDKYLPVSCRQRSR